MQNQTKKFFLYARKSTDEPERQVLSIEAQITELKGFARKLNLSIVDTLIEKQTAKKHPQVLFLFYNKDYNKSIMYFTIIHFINTYSTWNRIN